MEKRRRPRRSQEPQGPSRRPRLPRRSQKLLLRRHRTSPAPVALRREDEENWSTSPARLQASRREGQGRRPAEQIWKELGLNQQGGSRLAIRLEKRGMIKRVRSRRREVDLQAHPLRLPRTSPRWSRAVHSLPGRGTSLGHDRVNPFTCPLIGPWVVKNTGTPS